MALHVLCIDDDKEILTNLKVELSHNFEVSIAHSIRAALEVMDEAEVDAVLLDIGLDGVDGLAGLKLIKERNPYVSVMMITGLKDTSTVVKAIKAGALDYFCKPLEVEQIKSALKRIDETKLLREHNQALLATLKNGYMKIPMVGKSQRFRQLIDQATMVKGYDANVLIYGESGTGKELLARYIHSLEADSARPFIAVNCAAIPENLLESELFGHEKGAFTGAVVKKIGKFELAGGGDVFLDEVSSLRLDLQSKVLRALQERCFTRVGGNEQINSKFRVIAATNMVLEDMIAEKSFRMDLFHRLRVVSFHIPSLRERREDIPELVQIFLEKHSKKGFVKRISHDALQILVNYSWPGNIRELENLIQSLIIMTQQEIIGVANLPDWLNKDGQEETADDVAENADIFSVDNVTYKDFVKKAEREYIKKVLEKFDGNRAKAAENLNIGRSTFYIKLRELGLADGVN